MIIEAVNSYKVEFSEEEEKALKKTIEIMEHLQIEMQARKCGRYNYCDKDVSGVIVTGETPSLVVATNVLKKVAQIRSIEKDSPKWE